MKKFNKKQLASWINKAVEESSSAYIPFPIADHIAEQLCLYFEEEDPDQFTYHITPKGRNAVDREKLHVLHD